MKDNSKNKYFIIAALILSILFIDIGLQFIHIVSKGYPTWHKKEIFRVRNMTYIVNDERFISLRKNIKNNRINRNLDICKECNDNNWKIITDNNGFRSGISKISSVKNLLFIGDSVPFGWGVNVEDSVPEKLNNIFLKNEIKIGIINAAIPSYSLDQAIHRYLFEIKNKFPVKIIILQIYDPAAQFAKLGDNWDTKINYTTSLGNINDVAFRINRENYFDKVGWFRYSSFTYLYWLFNMPEKTDELAIFTRNAVNNYKNSIMNSLDILLKNARGSKIILLPPNIPINTWNNKSFSGRKSLELIINYFEDFSKKNKDVYFLDVISLFRSKKGKIHESLFIDKCCHLSGEGATLQAQAIYNFIENRQWIK